MNTKNQTNLSQLVIGKYERFKKKKTKQNKTKRKTKNKTKQKTKQNKKKTNKKKKNHLSGTVCLLERLIVHISTT